MRKTVVSSLKHARIGRNSVKYMLIFGPYISLLMRKKSAMKDQENAKRGCQAHANAAYTSGLKNCQWCLSGPSEVLWRR